MAADQTEGPFHVGNQTFTFVKHVQKIEGSKSPHDSTVEWWELRDATGKAVFREQYQVAFWEQLTFVRLFSEPDPGFTPKHVVIKPESKIEYVEAEMPVSWNSDQHNTTFGVSVSNAPHLQRPSGCISGLMAGTAGFPAKRISKR